MVAEETASIVGTWLGWVMAAIYMGGRLPQILKNVTSQRPILNAREGLILHDIYLILVTFIIYPVVDNCGNI